MTDRPILFTGPMVRAILDGRKTVTRRLVTGHDVIEERDDGTPWPYCTTWSHGDDGSPWQACPYGVPGDRLWVKETFAERVDIDGKDPAQRARAKHYLMFKANGDDPRDPDNFHTWGRWRSPRYMPRWASRITIDVISVRVERLHAITEEDARAEGVRELPLQEGQAGAWWTADPSASLAAPDPVLAFCKLWDSLNAKRAPWASDPWVWRVEFRQEVTP